MSSGGWQGKVVIITGGSAGFGRAITQAFASAGAHVVMWARDPQRLEEVSAEFAAKKLSVSGDTIDITNQEEVTLGLERVIQKYGRLDVFVNNAGKSIRRDLLKTTVDDYRQLMELNFFAAVQCGLAAIPELEKTSGHLVNIGSLASKTAWPFVAPYATSKFALCAFNQQCRLEGPKNVHFMLVCPGPIRRDDSASRYVAEATNLPTGAATPGAGAPMKGIDPVWLAGKIVRGCEKRQLEIVVPFWPKYLVAIGQISPWLGDKIVRWLKSLKKS